MVKPMPKAEWLADTTWYHVVSANQSALRADFILAVPGLTIVSSL